MQIIIVEGFKEKQLHPNLEIAKIFHKVGVGANWKFWAELFGLLDFVSQVNFPFYLEC